MSAFVWVGIAAGGGLGALARWRLDLLIRHWVTTRVNAVHQRGEASCSPADASALPGIPAPRVPASPMLGIGVVNVFGCLLVGLVTGLVATNSPVGLIVSTGFLGGFTTFSTAVVDVWTLWRHGRRAASLGLALGVWVMSLVAVLIGFGITAAIH